MIILQLDRDQLSSLIRNSVRKVLEEGLFTQQNDTEEPSDRFLSISEAAEFLNLAVPTLYSKVSKGEIPYIMQCSKRLYFSEQELLTYIKAVRRKTKGEIAVEADELLTKKKGGESSIDYNKTPNDNYSEDMHSVTQRKSEQTPREKARRLISLLADGLAILTGLLEIFG